MRFIVVGAGAIGCYIGGRLAVNGAAVYFVGRQHSVDSLKTGGLKITDLDGFERKLAPDNLRTCLSLEELRHVFMETPNTPAPIIFVCVKSGATDEVGRDIERYCPAGTRVFSFQNGVENVARLKTHAPSMQVLAAMVPYNVMMKSASHCHRATAGTLLIEHFEKFDALDAVLKDAGLNSQFRSDMQAVQWGKLLLNLNNPVNALSNLPLKAQLEDRDYRRVLAMLQNEALSVLGSAGIVPAKVGKVGPHLLPKLLNLPNWVFTRIARSMLKMDSSARSSMWVDLQAGKPTEIDDLCGAVVRLAKRNGRSAIANNVMIRLIEAHQPNEVWDGKKLFRNVACENVVQES
jgi:2-dehydropantoate 2-reductase